MKLLAAAILLMLSVVASAQTPRYDKEIGDSVYNYVETRPIYPDGGEAFLKYIKDFKLPKGTTWQLPDNRKLKVVMVIGKRGNIASINFSEQLQPEVTEAVKKYIKAGEDWQPATLHGKSVNYVMAFPIELKIQGANEAAPSLPTPSVFITESPVDTTYRHPEYPNGGEKALLQYINERVEIPAGFDWRGKEKYNVLVNFHVSLTGAASETHCIGGDRRIYESIANILRTIPKWIPGISGGKPKEMVYQLVVVVLKK